MPSLMPRLLRKSTLLAAVAWAATAGLRCAEYFGAVSPSAVITSRDLLLMAVGLSLAVAMERGRRATDQPIDQSYALGHSLGWQAAERYYRSGQQGARVLPFPTGGELEVVRSAPTADETTVELLARRRPAPRPRRH